VNAATERSEVAPMLTVYKTVYKIWWKIVGDGER
jgi:hypothetical protein